MAGTPCLRVVDRWLLLAPGAAAPTVSLMTRSASLHQPSTSHMSAVDAGTILADAAQDLRVQQREAEARFLSEIATLEALEDAAFADVVPASRAPVFAQVVARGVLEP